MRGYAIVETSDSELARRARAGELAAFEAIVDRHYADCLRYAVRMLGNRADAEEAVQDAFLRAYGAMGRYDERDRLRGWLYRILVNRCRSYARRRARGWAFLTRLQWLGAEPARVDPPVMEEEGSRLQRALAALPPPQREALLLKYLEELSYPEMSEVTGVGISALKMRVKRACERLGQLLTEDADV